MEELCANALDRDWIDGERWVEDGFHHDCECYFSMLEYLGQPVDHQCCCMRMSPLTWHLYRYPSQERRGGITAHS